MQISDFLMKPPNYVAARFSHSDVAVAEEIFKGFNCVWSEEVSEKYRKHYHAIIIGGKNEKQCFSDRVGKFNKAREEGEQTAFSWSSENFKKDFMKGISYTIKDGVFHVQGDISQWMSKVVPWTKKDKYVPKPMSDKKYDDKSWTLTYSNIVRLALRYAEEQGFPQETTLDDVLEWIAINTKWQPCPPMAKEGLPPYYFHSFTQLWGQSKGLKMPVEKWWKARDYDRKPY